MDIFFQLFIHPLEVFLGWMLFTAYRVMGDYGVALLFLSLAMNLTLWPLYVITERWQAAERQMQSLLQPKLSEIRKAFSGKERFAMVHTLYRQVGYHPIYALRSSLRMLIQVPFLIAAFSLLSEAEPLQGISWWIFDDLMQPDGLLWGGNLMPWVMTGVSILSIFCYRPRFGRRETWQFIMMSGVFLVVLYSSPVALVLFWTFNLVCSLLMNVGYVWWKTNQAQPEQSGILGARVSLNSAREPLPEIIQETVWRKRVGVCGKRILDSPYVLALLVGAYPVVFYLSTNWFMFNVADGLFVAVTFSAIVFVIMSTVYALLSLVVQRCVSEGASTIMKRLVVLIATFMLAYLLRSTFLAMAGYQPLVVVSVASMVALIVAWCIPRIGIYRVNAVLFLLCGFHLAHGLYSFNSAEANSFVQNVAYDQQRDLYDQVVFTQTPNVYYIVPDGYPNQEALEKIFHINNREFYEQLESLGFNIHYSAFSNYRSTLSSLSATFGMGHHFYGGSLGNLELSNSREFLVSNENPVVRIFKNNGYRVNFIHGNESMFTSGCYVDVCSPNVFLGEFINLLVPEALDLDLETWLPVEADRSYVTSIRRIVKHVERISAEQPNFTFVHMEPPGHSPPERVGPQELVAFREGYRRKVELANQHMRALVQTIIARDPQAIIILNADHGAWGFGAYHYNRPELFDGVPDRLIGIDHLGVLLAIRWPESMLPIRQDIRTNVNLFRYVFSYLSGKDILLASKADEDGFLTKEEGSEEVLVRTMHRGMVLDDMIELGAVESMEVWSRRGYGKMREPRWYLQTFYANDAEFQIIPGRLPGTRVEISRADTKVSWHIQLNQKPVSVDGNARYSLRFRARADNARAMEVAVIQAHSPWEDLGPYRTVSVTKEWQEYDWDFVATDDDDNAQLHFNLGGWNVPVELDGVRLLKLSHGTPQWTLNLVGRSEAGIVGIAEEPEGLRVAITTVDRKIPYDIQLTQEGIRVQAQARYRVRFEARADAAREIAVAVGQAHDPWEELGLYRQVSLNSDWQEFEFEFLARQTDAEARLYFDLGGDSSPVELKAVQFSTQPKILIKRQVPSRPGSQSVFDPVHSPSG